VQQREAGHDAFVGEEEKGCRGGADQAADRLTTKFAAAGQPVEDAARSRNITLDGVRVSSQHWPMAGGPGLWPVSGHCTLVSRFARYSSTLAWKRAITVEWKLWHGRAGQGRARVSEHQEPRG
jgi:hypothetical protein